MRTHLKTAFIVTSLWLLFSCSSDDDQPTPNPDPPAAENEAPEINSQSFTVKENVTDDVVIGTIVATDKDKDALTFSLIQNSNDLFELTDAGELSLIDNKTLDFETVTSHTLTVEVSDGKNKASADITITVENVVEPFVTTWKTTAANEEIIYQLNDQLTYDITIDWGDGSTDTKITSTPKHTYTEPGTYTISVSGVLPSVRFGLVERSALKISTLNAEKLQTIEAWGDNVWESMESMFAGCNNMTYNATDVPNLSMVSDMSGMFAGATSFNGDISTWDVSKVTNMRAIFASATSFNADISSWDVSNITNMRGAFSDATSFDADISSWDVSNVTDMAKIFDKATSFSGDLSSWDVSKVQLMGNMLNNTNISMANYDKLLIAWAALPNLQSNVTFGAGGLEYCGGTRARNTLINDKGWTITGDSASSSCT